MHNDTDFEINLHSKFTANCRHLNSTPEKVIIKHNIYKSMKNAIFWDVTLCGSCKNRRFVGT
jgi:hypothetical protein